MNREPDVSNTMQSEFTFSLAPGFSRVCGSNVNFSRFNDFSSPAKTVETVFRLPDSYTRLKPGANESGIALLNGGPASFNLRPVHHE
ncbi:MAG: hypothetical protein FD161_4355 [Limisphaerales bacterium]|nr:MAG: hypothetical protein FD161_4355 [Limisphaerales bacterium]KAG0506968.1 MAG: hypothetical protein E1N63_3863 [Limisphaerales bacterium]TXT47208.1 MAG: hypothetical protein FD140_4281 [Limisphaerales bacterium]